MNKLFLLFYSFLILSNISAQEDLQTLLDANEIPHCEELAIQSQEAIRKIDMDSIKEIKSLLGKWEKECGINEPIYRLKLLLNIKEDKPIGVFYTDEYQSYFDEYECRVKASEKWYDAYCNSYQTENKDALINKEFDFLTKSISYELLVNDSLGLAEKTICFHYNNQFDKSKEYAYYVKNNKKLMIGDSSSCQERFYPFFILNLSPEMRFQTYFGDIKNHMEHSMFLGGNIGFDIHNIKIYGKVGVAINLQKDSFYIEHDNQTKLVSNRVGVYTGGGISVPIFKKNTNFFMYAKAGAGTINYEFPVGDNDSEEKYNYLRGYALDVGFVFNWKIKKRCRYLGIMLDYQYIDFKLSENLLQERINGHGLSIGLVWGFKNRSEFILEGYMK